MDEPLKLPKRVIKIIDACRRGRVLVVQMRQSEAKGIFAVYSYLEGGKELPATSAREAIKSGYLVPGGDSLLGAEMSQTWRAR